MKNSYLIALVLVAALCAAVFGYYKYMKPAKLAKADSTSSISESTPPKTIDDIPGAKTSSLDPAGSTPSASNDDPFASPSTPGPAPRLASGSGSGAAAQPSSVSLAPLPGPSRLGAPSSVQVAVGPSTQPSARLPDESTLTGPVARSASASAHAPTPGTYTIKAGDVLSVVSKEQLGSARLWKKIVAANPGLDPDHLHVGQVITLPQISAKPASSSQIPLSSPDHMTSTADRLDNATIVPVSNPINPVGFHIVKTGETLSSIAREVYPHGGGTWKTLFNANHTALENKADNIVIGMKLVIPAPR